jgi:hypothetical protein
VLIQQEELQDAQWKDHKEAIKNPKLVIPLTPVEKIPGEDTFKTHCGPDQPICKPEEPGSIQMGGHISK